jgi:hypothetical protein
MLLRFFCFVFAALALTAGRTHAQTLAFSISANTATNGGRQPFLGSSGLYFTLNVPLTISSLGYWDDGRDGVNAPITVSIFDRTSTGAPVTVAGTQVSLEFTGLAGTLSGGIMANQLDSNPPGSSDRPGQFRLANLSAPVLLPAGQYALVAWGFNGANQILNGSHDGPVLDIETFSEKLHFDGSAYDDTAGVFPTHLDPSDGSIIPLYVMATFSPDTVTAIPEPADVALAFAATALAGAVIVRRHRRGAGVR